MKRDIRGAMMLWVAPASCVLASASRDGELFPGALSSLKSPLEERLFRRDAETSTRDAHATRRTTERRKSMLVLTAVFVAIAQVYGLTPGDLSRVTFEQHPGLQVSGDLIFRDESDRLFRLGDYFGKQPTILVLGYYGCPMLCSLINDGLIQALQELPVSVGKDFQVIDVSIDPAENATAAAKKSEYLRQYARRGAADGWHFLVGDKPAIAQLADQVGFRYAYDPQIRQYAHPSGVVVLTPEGKISGYVFGVRFDAKELRDALVAAKDGKSSSIISQVFLLCYHYNPITGKYGGLILSILRIASLGFLAAIALWIFSMARRSAGGPAQIN